MEWLSRIPCSTRLAHTMPMLWHTTLMSTSDLAVGCTLPHLIICPPQSKYLMSFLPVWWKGNCTWQSILILTKAQCTMQTHNISCFSITQENQIFLFAHPPFPSDINLWQDGDTNSVRAKWSWSEIWPGLKISRCPLRPLLICPLVPDPKLMDASGYRSAKVTVNWTHMRREIAISRLSSVCRSAVPIRHKNASRRKGLFRIFTFYTFTIIWGFADGAFTYILKQGGRSWQAFGKRKKCLQFFRRTRICYYQNCNKKVVFT